MDTVNALQALVNSVTHHAWKLKTLECYQGGMNRFLAFCSSNNIPLSFPSPEWPICAFAAHRAGSCSGSAIANDVAGLHAWHIANGFPWLGGTCLKYVLHSAVRLTPDSSKRPPRPPVTSEMLNSLHSSLDASVSLRACILACANSVFWGQGRLGEFLSTSQAHFSPKLFPTPACLRSTSSGKSLMCRLPWTKVSKEKGEDVFLGRQLGPSDPISSLLAHLAASPDILVSPASSHLFAYSRGAGGRLVSLTKRKFLLVCNSVWAAQGLPHISGHCFHIGGTIELLLHNVPPHIVKVMGRWSSDSFLCYWHNLEHIAHFMQSSWSSSELPRFLCLLSVFSHPPSHTAAIPCFSAVPPAEPFGVARDPFQNGSPNIITKIAQTIHG
ncbi:hypothetical protein DFH29DRAFT_985628 [Suillus ampliporus]|nr:hypothetical protein DFH29DRAFT_985628 [Suillus ampliporus]